MHVLEYQMDVLVHAWQHYRHDGLGICSAHPGTPRQTWDYTLAPCTGQIHNAIIFLISSALWSDWIEWLMFARKSQSAL